MLFSAEESVYEAWYPITGCWLDIGHADVRLPWAELERPRAGRLHGRWRTDGDHLMTAVLLPVAGREMLTLMLRLEQTRLRATTTMAP